MNVFSTESAWVELVSRLVGLSKSGNPCNFSFSLNKLGGFVLADGDGITRLRVFPTDQGQLEIFVMIAQKPDWLPIGSWSRREDGFWQSPQWGFGTTEEMIQSVEKVCCAILCEGQ
jgi:hypothetical protein